MENTIEKQMKKIAILLRNEQIRLGLTEYEMSIRIDVSYRQYIHLIKADHAQTYGYSLDTLNKIFENTNIECCDVFKL